MTSILKKKSSSSVETYITLPDSFLNFRLFGFSVFPPCHLLSYCLSWLPENPAVLYLLLALMEAKLQTAESDRHAQQPSSATGSRFNKRMETPLPLHCTDKTAQSSS